MLFLYFGSLLFNYFSYVVNKDIEQICEILLTQQNTTNILRTKAMVNLYCFRFPREAKNAHSIYLALNALFFIRNDSLTSEDSKAKNSL